MAGYLKTISLLAGVLAISLAGCALDLGDSPFKCNKGGKPLCPSGYECRFSEWCVKEGTCPDSLTKCGGLCGNGKCDTGEQTSCPQDCKTNNEAGPPPDLGVNEGGNPPPDMPPLPLDMPPLPPDMPPLPPDMPPVSGAFGDKCIPSAPKCNTGLKCISIGSATTAGFCSKTCPTIGSICTGQPTGTSAYCLLTVTGGPNYCAFLCKLSTQTWSCPSTLTCSSTPNPPTSSQYPCMP